MLLSFDDGQTRQAADGVPTMTRGAVERNLAQCDIPGMVDMSPPLVPVRG